MQRFLLLSALSLALAGTASADTAIGYTTGSQGRDYIFSSNSLQTGLAASLPASKTALLAGCKVKAVEVAFGTKNAVDNAVTLFLGSSAEAPAYTQKATISKANKWLTFELDTPYEIDPSKPLVAGYTATLMNESYSALSADLTRDLPGATLVWNGSEWTDFAGRGRGCANIRLILDGDPAFADLTVKPFEAKGYFKAGQEQRFTAQLFNFGTKPVVNPTVKAAVGGATPSEFTLEATINPMEALDVELPPFTAQQSGMQSVGVNAVVAGDADTADNAASVDAYFYPADMERSILLEGFTGQGCSNCPRGHQQINQCVQEWVGDPVVEISHHCGYQPDQFTMAEDYDFTYFYLGSMYAPAVAVNRLENPENALPTFNCSIEGINAALADAATREPYVSLKLTSEFDPATRNIRVRVDAYSHHGLPTPVNAINVAICQDGIKAQQTAGGSDYVHNSVFRGMLSSIAEGQTVSWGIARNFAPQTNDSLVIETTLPEAIRSSYYTSQEMLDGRGYDEADITWPIDPDNMYLVAYVAAFTDNDPNGHQVYNCISVPLNGTATQGGFAGIDTPEINLPAEADDPSAPVRFFDLTGREVANPSQGGLYIRLQGRKATKVIL